MSVKFKSLPKGQPGVAGGGNIKYYATIVRGEKVDTRKFAEDIAEMNLMSTTAVFAVLEAFFKRSGSYLAEGRTLDLGQFGIFTPHINSTAAESPDKVNQNSISRYKVIYRPSKLLNKQLKNVEFQKLSNGTATEEVL
jgi:predicted histone-like DNA-binding protein